MEEFTGGLTVGRCTVGEFTGGLTVGRCTVGEFTGVRLLIRGIHRGSLHNWGIHRGLLHNRGIRRGPDMSLLCKIRHCHDVTPVTAVLSTTLGFHKI